MDDFEKELKTGFLDEANQNIEEAEQAFLEIETKPNEPTIIDKIFRLAHNLKGSSKAVGFDQLGEFTHKFENLLLKIKNKELQINSSIVSLLLLCNDHLKHFINELKNNLDAKVNSDELEQKISLALDGKFESELDPTLDPTPTPPDASLFEEPCVIPPEMTTAPRVEPKPMDESIRVSLSKLEKLINYVGEMVVLQTVLREQAASNNFEQLKKSILHLESVSKEVQDLSMGLRMLPVKPVFQKMQRIVRDTASVLDKKVNFIMEGEETAIDKTVLDRISDPLVHLIRNAVDHGVESKEKRLESGKNEVGQILLKAFHRSDKLIIEIKDDGGGINHETLINKAKAKGILKPDQKIDRNEGIHLVFHPGFSTKEVTTDVSGRGVGMDVVKTNIEALQGEVEIDTEINKGTTFRIILPLTLAIVEGIIIDSDKENYIIPLSLIRETLRPKKDEVQYSKSVGEVLLLRGENIPLYRLDILVGKKNKPKKISDSIVLVIKYGQQDFGLLVDDIINQQQVVIKKLGKELGYLKGFSGSAILGTGRPALILEPADLLAYYLNKYNKYEVNLEEKENESRDDTRISA
jgi:two-component system chemotaxis sensor kinase CheA